MQPKLARHLPQGYYTHYHTTHASIYPHHSRKHATHVTHSSTLALHLRKHVPHVTHANTPPTLARKAGHSQTLICQT